MYCVLPADQRLPQYDDSKNRDLDHHIWQIGKTLWNTLSAFHYEDFNFTVTHNNLDFSLQYQALPFAHKMEDQSFSFYQQLPQQEHHQLLRSNGWNSSSPEFIPTPNGHLPYGYKTTESSSPPMDPPFGSYDDSRSPIPSLIEPIFKNLKSKEKNGYDSARNYGVSCLEMVPSRLQWRLYLELADIAKRESIIRDARTFYKKATLLHPHASQPWLEYAKLEDECGALVRCQRILATALQCCPFNEGLMVKAIKLEEKLGNYNAARQILSGLRYVSLEKGWRVMLEGGLLEARAGNTYVARKIFKYLMQNAAGYGNVFQESSLLEERCENYYRAIEIAEKGLEENPRYGPLYLTVLRLQEKVACGDLTKTRQVVERAIKFIPKELKWKVYFEAAQIEDRAGNLELSRQNYVHSVANCPNNLLWKVWIAGARTELRAKSNAANKLVFRSLRDVPQKKKAQVWLEWAHIEEYQGNIEKARQVLKQAREEASQEWKVFLETILLEIRANNTDKAIEECRKALKIHTGTGRLWALLIQLRQDEGEEAQLEVFREALQEVPKSGEVWCEGARIYLRRKDWNEARKYLEFAIHFTPQFGDSFIEYLRLELLEHGKEADLTKLELLCVNAEPNYGTLWMYCKEHPLFSTQRVLRCAREIFERVGTDGGETVLALGKLEAPLSISKEEEWRLIFGCDDLKP